MTPSVRVAKRTIDIAASVVGLCLTAPLYPLIAIAIKVEDPGPVFYRQRRAGTLGHPAAGGDAADPAAGPGAGGDAAHPAAGPGAGGDAAHPAAGPGAGGDAHGRMGAAFVEFDMRKFRTMRVDAEKLTGPVLAQQNDPRVTRVGKWLRRTRLDELPQLWNVLVGEMSLVGPRPERPELLADLARAIPFFEERMRGIKPGITGLAQVSLGYAGRAPAGSEAARHEPTLTNPFALPEAEGALADEMRMKLLFDLAYAAALENLRAYLGTELGIIVRTPLVMALGLGR